MKNLDFSFGFISFVKQKWEVASQQPKKLKPCITESNSMKREDKMKRTHGSSMRFSVRTSKQTESNSMKREDKMKRTQAVL